MPDEILGLNERILKAIELGESHFREFKSALERDKDGKTSRRQVKSICTDIGEALVSFSNADGGELFVGVEDDGTISGVPHAEDRIEVMMNAYKTHVHVDTPLSPPLVKTITTDGLVIVYFRVEKSLSWIHLTSDGRCLQRFDRGNRPVSVEGLQLERQEDRSREYDREFVPNATVQDLNLQLVDSVGKQLAPGFSPEKLLQFLGLGDYGTHGLQLRRAALMLFAKDILKWHPRCEVRILRVAGTEIGEGAEYNVLEDETVRGNIAEILDGAWDRLRPYLARTKFQSDALFRESIIYPEDACREALINAVAHRDYSTEGEPIEITILDDRMEIRNPGRLLSSMSVEQLAELERAHESRNVYTARVLRELGFMRELGEGMRRIFASVRRFDLVDPELRSDKNHFAIVLFHRSVFSAKDVQWLESYSEFDLTKDEQRVVLLGRDDNMLSTAVIISTLGLVDTEDFRATFEEMRRKGLIYSARVVTTGRKRQIPRFRIRSPQEAKQYLDELKRSLITIGTFERFEKHLADQVGQNLSQNSPYKRKPEWALAALGFTDASRRPLPKMSELWKSAPKPVPKAEQSDLSKPRRLIGRVTAMMDKGFGFAQTENGEDYYLHVYAFDHSDDFQRLSVGDSVSFEPGVRSIPGKARSAKTIRLV